MENNTEEIWKDVVGCEGYYQVSNLGRIKSLDRQIVNRLGVVTNFSSKIMYLKAGKFGYIIANINTSGYKRQVKAHRLVAMAFIPNPLNKPQVNHINGIKTDNRVENLEWCTASENRIHALKTGLANSSNGINQGNSKLTNEQVLKIRELALHGMNSIQIRKEIGIENFCKSQICDIIKRKAWKHI